MNHINSDNEQFLNRLRSSMERAKQSDKEKIGEALCPEEISADFSARTAVFRYRFYPWMLNCNDVMHGGSVALLMDTSMGLISSAYPEKIQITPTVSIQITYLNPICLRNHIMVEAKVNAVKSRLIYAEAVLYAEEEPDKPLAKAMGEYYRMPSPSR